MTGVLSVRMKVYDVHQTPEHNDLNDSKTLAPYRVIFIAFLNTPAASNNTLCVSRTDSSLQCSISDQNKSESD